MHVRCPHCHNPIEVVDDAPLSDLSCPSCGSVFSLVGDDTTATFRPEARKIGHFELVEPVGMGRFGTVWKARDTELDRTVAVKIPRKEQLDPREAEQFFREARAAAQLKHPGIVTVHEVGREDETIYIVSDYIHGANLQEWLTAQKLTLREAVELTVKIAAALHHAHTAGVIHRDLKPGNILIDADGEPHIADFGLAKRESGEITMTVDGHILGTPAYMPPEQATGKGHESDARSDIYSLGVILYELTTGEPPFRGDKRMLLLQIEQDEPPTPRKLNSRIPRDLETITLKCLEKEPARRYQTAQQLADDLNRHLAGEPIHARPVGRAEWAWRWCKRQPMVAGLVTAVAFSLMAGTVVSTYFAIAATVQRERADDNAEKERLARIEAEAVTARLERFLYASDMNLAQRYWGAAKISGVLRLLETHRPAAGETDLRGWEWFYQWRLCHSLPRTLGAHSGAVTSVVFSPDGKRLASASSDRTIKLWDAESGAELRTLKGHSSAVTSVAFSPDGRRLASSSEDRTVKLWDAESGAELRTLKGHSGAISSVVFSPDGKRLALASSDRTIKLWDAESGAELRTLKGHSSAVTSVAFSPDGRRLASSSEDKTVKLWDAESGAELRTLKGHSRDVNTVAFSPDGRLLASASSDRTVKIWDAGNGENLFVLIGHSSDVNSVAFSPDGSQLATASSDRTIQFWDAENGRRLRKLLRDSGEVYGVAFSPDGKQLASASSDRTITVWGAGLDAQFRTLEGHSSPVRDVTFSPDGRRLASASEDQTVKLWDAESGEVLRSLKGHTAYVISVAFSPDGSRLASASRDKTVKLWDAEIGVELRTLEGHTEPVNSVVFSPDGSRLASASRDNSVKLWDADSGEVLRTLKGHTAYVYSVAFSPDGSRLASASRDDTVKIWDGDSGAELRTLKGHSGDAISVAFSPDGERLAMANSDGTFKIWDAENGEELRTIEGHVLQANRVTFSPDGRRLVSASQDGTVKIWDAEIGVELRTLEGHTEPVNSVAFSPDGWQLASASDDGTIKLWDATILTSDEVMARSLVRGLFDELASPDEVIRMIEQKTHWNEAMRKAALDYARRRMSNTSTAQLNDVSP